MSKRAKLVELYKQGHTDKTAGPELAKQNIKTSRSFRWAIYKRYKQGEFSREPTTERGEVTTKKKLAATRSPSLKLKIDGTKTPDEKLRIMQPGTPSEPPTLPPDMAFTPEECSYIFELANQIIPEKRRPSNKSESILGKLWHKPINNLIEKYSEQNPLLVIATILTGAIYLPVIIGVVQDWRESKEKEKKKVKPKEDSKKD